jgi:hypothetical protein
MSPQKIRFRLALYIDFNESSSPFKNKLKSPVAALCTAIIWKLKESFNIPHTNFNILIFTVFIYIDLGVLKALLNKYANPSPLHSLSAICSAEFKTFNIYLIKFSMFKMMFRKT